MNHTYLILAFVAGILLDQFLTGLILRYSTKIRNAVIGVLIGISERERLAARIKAHMEAQGDCEDCSGCDDDDAA